jgi:hypothetical protein
MKPFKFLTIKPKPEIEIPEGHEFAGVTPTLYEPHTFDAIRYVLIRDLSNNEVRKYCQIYVGDPLWDYNE